jgi:hypothetical protein
MKADYDLTSYFNRCSVSWYQENCRIYIDEFPEAKIKSVSEEYNEQRIKNMVSDTILCICPNCTTLVYPKFVDYFPKGRSGLYWCPTCFKGKAGMFWRKINGY